MAHDFLIKDIAFQAGLSEATVDRVLNARGGVRRQTVQRVEAAIAELRTQERNVPLARQRYVLDVVMEAPDRFTAAVRTALETASLSVQPAVFHCRYHLAERMRQTDMLGLLDRIRSRGSHGVVLKAPDEPAIAHAVDRLEEAGIPVVALVTDISHCRRTAYAGSDNRAAGETAAYLIGEKLEQGTVLVTLSSNRFRGEEEREIGFRRVIRERYPALSVVDISEGYGRDSTTFALVRSALAADPTINAVYSIGGGNRAVLDAFAEQDRPCSCIVAHDLDADNLALLRAGLLHYVLHHDLESDAASIYRTVLKARHGGSSLTAANLSALEIITPFNIPA